MKNILIFLIVIANFTLFLSCSKNDKNLFSQDYNAISFYAGDSTNVNFLFYPEEKILDTVKIRVYLTGVPKDYDRFYNVKLIEDKTTAIEGVHFISLQDKYVFKAKSNYTELPIVLKRDVSLADANFRLAIELEESDDFILGPKMKKGEASWGYRYSTVITTTANLDIPPPFWENNYLDSYSGPYHPLKCKKFIEIAGVDKANWIAESSADKTLYIKKIRKWFQDNPTYDEDGVRLFFE